jgi:FkbM family methyltransferase
VSTPLTEKLEKALNYYRWFGLRGFFFVLQGARIMPGSRTTTISAPGVLHPVDLRLRSSDLHVFGKVLVDHEYGFEPVAQPKTILDAGANIGLASIHFANRFPEATILALEPENSNFELLKQNAAPYPKIMPVRGALWSENCSIELVAPGAHKEWNKWGFRTKSAGANKATTSDGRVEGMTVDRILRDHSIDFLDVLKVDIEGAEKEVFTDASAWIDKVGMVIIELHESFKPGCNRAFYHATQGFNVEWQQGENYFVTRDGKCWPPVGGD